MKRIILAISTIVLLSGCYSSGNKIDARHVSNFSKDVTTVSDVRLSLGEPNTVTVNSLGESTFVYVYMNTEVKGATFIPIVGAFAGGATSEVQTLTIVFNTDGTIKDWSMSNTNTEV